ncbi:MAG: cell division protein FtsQ/DivIB [Acutalibacteraceae bacterium]
MENRNRKNKTRKKAVIKPPKKKASPQLSRDEMRNIKKKKVSKRRKLKRHLLSFLLAVVVLCVGTVLVFSVFFKINTISVTGDNVYSEKMVIEKSGIELGTNLFGVNSQKLSEKLSSELPYIKNVTVEKELPETLVINIEATREVAAIVNNGAFVLIDETGKVLDRDASVLRENVAVINNVKLKEFNEGRQIVLTDEKKNDALITLLGAIKNAGLELLTEIDLKNVNDIKIKYDDRIVFELGSLTNVETKLARGKAALEKENEINSYSEGTLDLKTEPYVYFKSGSDDTTTESKDKKQQK